MITETSDTTRARIRGIRRDEQAAQLARARAVGRDVGDEGRDLGPSMRLTSDGRLRSFGPAHVILEDRDDEAKAPDLRGNRPQVRGARRRRVLADLKARNLITKQQYDAAEKFVDACSVASGGSGGEFLGLPSSPNARDTLPQAQLDAIREVRGVAVRMGLNRDVVFWRVVMEDQGLDAYDAEFRQRKGTAGTMLRAALDDLDDHYHPAVRRTAENND